MEFGGRKDLGLDHADRSRPIDPVAALAARLSPELCSRLAGAWVWRRGGIQELRRRPGDHRSAGRPQALVAAEPGGSRHRTGLESRAIDHLRTR